jgi:hypothetical protein
MDFGLLPEFGQEHGVQFHNTCILVTNTRYMDRIASETSKIELHPYVMRSR